jgi:hypothetical protein
MKNTLLIIGGIIVIALGMSLFFKDASVPPQACTADALICPDGSSVGRSGPDCQFEACPNQEFFVGTLEQEASGFRLLIEAPFVESPSGDTQEVTYALPLEIRVSNVLGQLVGREVRVIGEFIRGNTLRVETLEAIE